jgi:hypothetical protein
MRKIGFIRNASAEEGKHRRERKSLFITNLQRRLATILGTAISPELRKSVNRRCDCSSTQPLIRLLWPITRIPCVSNPSALSIGIPSIASPYEALPYGLIRLIRLILQRIQYFLQTCRDFSLARGSMMCSPAPTFHAPPARLGSFSSKGCKDSPNAPP